MEGSRRDHPTLDDVIQTYIQHGLHKRAEDSWAWQEFQGILLEGDETSWSAFLQLVEAAPDELLGYIGAGPAEDLIRAHPERFVPRMIERARLDPRFKAMLSTIWLSSGQIDPELEQGLVRATDGRLSLLPGSHSPGSTSRRDNRA